MTGKTHAPAFDFYPERFWFAVEGWSDSEIARYMRLLSHQWMRGGLPEQPGELAGLARGAISPRLLSKFPVWGDGQRRNRFLEALRDKQRERMDATSYRQTVTAWKRWHPGEALPPDMATIEAWLSSCRGNAMAYPAALPRECPPLTPHPSPLTPVTDKHAIDQNNDGRPTPTLEQVVSSAIALGGSEGAAKKWWHEHEAKGWKHRGEAIVKWWSMLKSYIEAIQAKAKAGTPLWRIKAERKELENDLQDVESYRQGPMGELPAKQKVRKKAIVARLAELQEMRVKRKKSHPNERE